MKFKLKITSDWNLTLLFGGVLLLLILFNVLSGLFFGYAYYDATSDKRYVLSDESRAFLQRNQIPLTIRFYISRDLRQASPRYGHYADYVNRMLNEYVSVSDGKIKLDVVEVTPYSSAEIEAEKVGLKPLDIAAQNHNVYLGANIIRPDGYAMSIHVFDIKRKSMLEDDLSRLMSILTASKAPLIGVMSPYFNVAASGKIVTFNDDWPFIKQLKAAGFRIKPLSDAIAFIPEDMDAVLVYYPISIMPLGLYALDQYLLRGGSVMVMLDSFSELKFGENSLYEQYNSGMVDFLHNLGVSYYDDILLGDLQNNQDIVIDGRKKSYPLYLKVLPQQMAQHPVMKNLNMLRLNYASPFNFDAKKSDLKITTLFSSGQESGLLPADWASVQSYDSLRQKIKSEDMSFPLALLLEGKFKPFYQYPLINSGEILVKMPLFINNAEKEGKLLLTGDSDMAVWSMWRGGSYDGSASFYSSDNMLFIRNALDYLSGNEYVSIGQKFISRAKQNLDNIFKKWAQDKSVGLQSQTVEELSEIKSQIHKITTENSADRMKISSGRQKKLYDLQNNEQYLEQRLKQIDYKIQEDYHRNKNYFAVLMMLLPALIAVLFIWVIYYCYRRFYLTVKEKKIYEKNR